MHRAKKRGGNNQSGVGGGAYIFERNQNIDTDQLKKVWFYNTALANGSWMVEQNCPLGWSTVYYWNGSISWIINSSRSAAGEHIWIARLIVFLYPKLWEFKNSASEARKKALKSAAIGSLICVFMDLPGKLDHPPRPPGWSVGVWDKRADDTFCFVIGNPENS